MRRWLPAALLYCLVHRTNALPVFRNILQKPLCHHPPHSWRGLYLQQRCGQGNGSMEVEGAPLLQGVAVTSAQGPHRSSLAVASRWWSVARLWWRSSDRRRAWTYVAACAAFSLANVGLLLWISYAQNALQSSLSEKQAGGWAWDHRCISGWGLQMMTQLPMYARCGWQRQPC